ncbi:Npt1/Npt2 family nucleotide transporter [Spirulina major CS-329]|uniref:Npt1/Npt2 family nucleotide transporter n=1 Tax=Spirulina TaxID=1154 RepID=UPI00232B071A|nr:MULTISPECIES: Npt1/Npt2 family nucleotide transporter [Spirulina]MDB9497061.1 Npt1/Npt2 family nucleotide transporter [Spirulina subsalsa CS-330]MDB9501651.1 Npt1/Npt2 family nucleotide transporter [Spirulina major CS-329]
MKSSKGVRNKGDWRQQLLKVVNLRPEEGERTFLMFAFYTITSVGLLWLEQCTIALFLERFGAEGLPLIYVASALMGSGLGFIYSWLQNNFPLKQVFIVIALLMSLPLLLFRTGLELGTTNGVLVLITVFTLRLWMDAEEILNDLNSQVAANQLFNIREIKRTYPIISSGLLVGDVVSGFSLPILIIFIGLKNVIFAASLMILLGGGVLLYLSNRYKQAFPDTPVRELDELQTNYSSRRTGGTLRRYIIPLFSFFILGELLFLLVEFQYLGELERVYPNTDEIAGFLGIFSGFLGICELATQWFVSSRAVERLGVFVAAMFLPVSLSILGFMTIFFDVTNLGGFDIDSAQVLFFGVIVLKFFDELLRYTLIAGIEPFLFQPLPAEIRSDVQTQVQGIAEPLSTGLTGLGILSTVWILERVLGGMSEEAARVTQGGIFVVAIVLFSMVWAASALLLRQSYVSLLVQSAENGRLGFGSVDLKAFKRAIIDSLDQDTPDEDKRSCIQLLERIDLPNAGELLAPRLVKLSPSLQLLSMKAMLNYPKPDYLNYVQRLIETKPSLDVLALALRYIWLAQPELETHTLKPYLNERVDAMVRGTAAGLILRRGTVDDRKEATATLERMLTSNREKDRVIGVQALQEADEASDLSQFYIPVLLQDESARVRCALLEAIAAKSLTDYYPSLLKGLYYRSTRDAAKQALVKLGDGAILLLGAVAEDIHKPDFIRQQAWSALAEIGTEGAIATLVQHLLTSWGTSRRNLLRILLKIPGDQGIEAVLEQIGRSGVEALIEQELFLLTQILSAELDFSPDAIAGREADLLRDSLIGMQSDILDRCFLVMKLLYPFSAIQAAILNLDSDSEVSIALGLEILDNTLDIPQKQALLRVMERRPTRDRLNDLNDLMPYEPLPPNERLRRLLDLRHFLSDWTLACCFHLAREQRWAVSREATLVGLRHPSSFVRESILAYLKAASPRTCLELLPILKNDPDPLVAAQVDHLKMELNSTP